MNKKNSSFGIAIAVLFVVFSPVQNALASVTKDDFPDPDSFIFIEEDDVWGKDDDLSFSKPVVLINGAQLTIEAGARIIFKNGENGTSFFGVYDGAVKALGTETQPIVITKESAEDSFFIDFYNDSAEISLFRHVHVIGGGEVFGGDTQAKANPFIKTALADDQDGNPALLYDYGRLHVENSVFLDSIFADMRSYNLAPQDGEDKSFLDLVNSNFTGLSGVPALVVDEHYCSWKTTICPSKIRFKNDWFGPIGEEKMVQGSVVVEGGRQSDLIADPLLLLPGIVGSQKDPDGKWVMDPILHAYDDIIESLKRNGYEEGINLFPMPYDWYRSNRDTALDVGEKIDGILSNTMVSKVDIVAHSMGGLVARQHIENDAYANEIDQLITLGTPHEGSPKSYLSWEGGESGIKLEDKVLKYIFNNEAEHAGYSELYRYIQDKAPSVGELLPDYDYLYDIASGAMRSYPNGYPKNEFLENLNSPEGLEKLQGVRLTNIVGFGEKLSSQNTISKIRVGKVADDGVSKTWEHGIPENFGVETTDQGLEYDEGDQTVPRLSAASLFHEDVLIGSNHLNLPTESQCHILQRLTAKTDCQFVDEWHIPNLLRLDVFSPVDIQVVSPNGLKVGKDFESDGFLNEIPGAYYTGSDTKNEFITIPNPEDGEYRILARGTDGGGAYRIEATKIAETASGDATESTATIEGEAVAGAMEEDMAIEVSADTVELKDERDIVAPTVTITSPEQAVYQNNGIIPVSYVIADDVSPEASLSVTVSLDGESYGKSDIDSSLLPLGAHTLSVSATDEAGNVGTMDANFTLETSWDALSKNIDHYASLGLLKNKGERQMLKSNIRNLDNMVELLAKYDIFFRQHSRFRDIFERQIAHQISILQKYVKQKSGKSINPIAAERLIESMEALKEGIGA